MKITRLKTFLAKPRWLFLKIHTDKGLVGLSVEGDEAAPAGGFSRL